MELIYSCKLGDLERVKQSIERGADVNFQNNDGSTALHIICDTPEKDSDLDIVKLLLDNGADVNIITQGGSSPLHWSCLYNKFEITKLLIDNGADVNNQNLDGISALQISCLRKYLNITKLLLENGADINITNMHGEDALTIARKYDFHDIIHILETYNQPIKRLRINLSKTIMFHDPITIDEQEINISKYIEQDRNNIIIVYNKNQYFFTNRTILLREKEKAFKNNLYDLKKIGFVYSYPCNIECILNNKENQFFSVVNNNYKKTSFMDIAVPSLEDNE